MTAFPVGVHTVPYSFTHSALDCMLNLADIGYRLFEVQVNRPHFWIPDLDADQRRDIPKRLADRGILITSLCFPSIDNNLMSTAPELRRQTLDVYRQQIELAGEWGIPGVLVIPGKFSGLLPAPAEWYLEWFVEGIGELGRYAGECGTGIVVENVPITPFPKATDLMEALDAVGNDNIGIIYDVANGTFAGSDPCEDLRLIKGRLKLVHLSDTRTDKFGHDRIGRGVVPFEAVGRTLREIGYEGASILEIVTHNADEDILESHRQVAQWGWEAAPS